MNTPTGLQPSSTLTWPRKHPGVVRRAGVGTEAVDRATRLAPGAVRHWMAPAEARHSRSRPAEALHAAGKATALAPDDPTAWLSQARGLAARARTVSELQDMDRTFRRCLERQAARPVASRVGRRQYGAFLVEQGACCEAADWLRQALRADPRDQTAAVGTARARRELGRERPGRRRWSAPQGPVQPARKSARRHRARLRDTACKASRRR